MWALLVPSRPDFAQSVWGLEENWKLGSWGLEVEHLTWILLMQLSARCYFISVPKQAVTVAEVWKTALGIAYPHG